MHERSDTVTPSFKSIYLSLSLVNGRVPTKTECFGNREQREVSLCAAAVATDTGWAGTGINFKKMTKTTVKVKLFLLCQVITYMYDLI